jgi:hypothetical protein
MDIDTSNLKKAVLSPRQTRESFVEATCIECGTIEEGFGFTVAKARNFAEIIENNFKIDITSATHFGLPNF